MLTSVSVIDQAYRRKILALEDSIIENLELCELEVIHLFAHGTYTRELLIPKGVVLTGEIHRHSCINIITEGRLRVVTADGTVDIVAPCSFVSEPGVKKAGYALENTRWINVFPWDGVATLEEVLDEIIVPSYEALQLEIDSKLERLN